jgi:hypothetical protein
MCGSLQIKKGLYMFEEKMKKVINDPHQNENDDRPKDKHDHHHGPHPDRPPEHEKKVVIYVNGRPFEWKKPTISFEEVIILASEIHCVGICAIIGFDYSTLSEDSRDNVIGSNKHVSC